MSREAAINSGCSIMRDDDWTRVDGDAVGDRVPLAVTDIESVMDDEVDCEMEELGEVSWHPVSGLPAPPANAKLT